MAFFGTQQYQGISGNTGELDHFNFSVKKSLAWMDVWGFPKMVGETPTNPMGFFLLKMISTCGVKWGYHHVRKHPYRCGVGVKSYRRNPPETRRFSVFDLTT